MKDSAFKESRWYKRGHYDYLANRLYPNDLVPGSFAATAYSEGRERAEHDSLSPPA